MKTGTRFPLLAVTTALLALTSQNSYSQSPQSLVVHEWGTFTSLQGSNGQVQEGLQHEEEQLPSFVHNRDPLNEAVPPVLGSVAGHAPPPYDPPSPDPEPTDPYPYPTHPCGKCMEFATPAGTPLAVTQKMETPVIYFYSGQPLTVGVDIGFPHGIISQYYPDAISFAPAIGAVTSLSGGSASFQVNLVQGPIDVPLVDSSSIYSPARNVHSTYVKSGSENERFIFYRGVGNFSTNLQITSQGGALSLHNLGGDSISAAFLVYVTETGGAIRALGSVSGQNTLNISAADVNSVMGAEKPFGQFMSTADPLLTGALKHTGLYRDEAQAMTNTWAKSYFKTPGLRVLYILPRSETDQILPLHLNPTPQSLIRTLVGRVEVMRDTDEQALLTAIHLNGDSIDLTSLGRFAEAKLRRVLSLTQDSNDQQSIHSLLSKL
jgi:hypothetical protein